MEVEILEFIIDIAVEELFAAIIATKCCQRSKMKWKKIRERWKHDPERSDRIHDIVSSKSNSPTLRSTSI